MAYNLGEIQPGAYVIKATASAAITKGYFVVITPTGTAVALYAGAEPGWSYRCCTRRRISKR